MAMSQERIREKITMDLHAASNTSDAMEEDDCEISYEEYLIHRTQHYNMQALVKAVVYLAGEVG